MAQHDYIIDNQTSASLRADLNNALAAIVSQNSGATAPTTTYANQFWYDTSTDTLKQRNETNTVWISLGTVDQTNNKFEPNQTFASQAEATAGTDNTKAMTALRTAQAIAVSSSMTLLGTLTTTSGSTVTLSGLTLTSYKQLILEWNGVSHNAGTAQNLNLGPQIIINNVSASQFVWGQVVVSLSSGVASAILTRNTSLPSALDTASQISQTGYSNATTSVAVSVGSGAFDAGSIRIYGVK